MPLPYTGQNGELNFEADVVELLKKPDGNMKF